jgi:hypothetical protein
VGVDGGVFTYIWCTLFYLCQLQGGDIWWGFYLHIEYTLLCQPRGGNIWWCFYLHMEYTLLCQLQGGGRWWGFYLHMEYTLLCQLQSGGRWWFVLLTYGVHYSMSAPGLLRTLFYVSSRVIKYTLLCQLQGGVFTYIWSTLF